MFFFNSYQYLYNSGHSTTSFL